MASLQTLKTALYGLPVPLKPPCYSPDTSVLPSKATSTSLGGGAGIGGSWEISVHSLWLWSLHVFSCLPLGSGHLSSWGSPLAGGCRLAGGQHLDCCLLAPACR